MRSQTALLLACASLFSAKCVAQTSAPAERSSAAACGLLAKQLFKCPQFGFSFKVPFGWVDRTQEMQSLESAETAPEEHATENAATSESAVTANASGSSKAPPNLSKPQTLLAIFERPPAAPGESVNSAVVIATEPRGNYPQVKTAADYFGPISDLTAQRGFKPLSDPYAFSVGATQLVREDFTGEHGKLTVFQSSLVMIAKGQIVSFTFVGGNEDDVEELIANLSFTASPPAKHARP